MKAVYFYTLKKKKEETYDKLTFIIKVYNFLQTSKEVQRFSHVKLLRFLNICNIINVIYTSLRLTSNY